MRNWTAGAAYSLQRSARPNLLVDEAVDPNPSAFPRCIPPCRVAVTDGVMAPRSPLSHLPWPQLSLAGMSSLHKKLPPL